MGYGSSYMKDLVGKVITEIWISPDSESIVFVDGNREPHGFYVDGDCCSYSWINDLLGVDALLGQNVLKIEDMEDTEIDNGDEYDCLQQYGVKFTTERGYFDLIHRNSSNGYYGGSLCGSENMVVTDDMIRVTKDWSSEGEPD